jgi:hypothetical protein
LPGAKLPEQRQFFFLFVQKKFWIFSWLLETRKNKEENARKKKILPSSLFFYFLFYSSCDFVFFLIGIFSPLANHFASPHVFVSARWFILTLFMFVTIHAP